EQRPMAPDPPDRVGEGSLPRAAGREPARGAEHGGGRGVLSARAGKPVPGILRQRRVSAPRSRHPARVGARLHPRLPAAGGVGGAGARLHPAGDRLPLPRAPLAARAAGVPRGVAAGDEDALRAVGLGLRPPLRAQPGRRRRRRGAGDGLPAPRHRADGARHRRVGGVELAMGGARLLGGGRAGARVGGGERGRGGAGGGAGARDPGVGDPVGAAAHRHLSHPSLRRAVRGRLGAGGAPLGHGGAGGDRAAGCAADGAGRGVHGALACHQPQAHGAAAERGVGRGVAAVEAAPARAAPGAAGPRRTPGAPPAGGDAAQPARAPPPIAAAGDVRGHLRAGAADAGRGAGPGGGVGGGGLFRPDPHPPPQRGLRLPARPGPHGVPQGAAARSLCRGGGADLRARRPVRGGAVGGAGQRGRQHAHRALPVARRARPPGAAAGMVDGRVGQPALPPDALPPFHGGCPERTVRGQGDADPLRQAPGARRAGRAGGAHGHGGPLAHERIGHRGGTGGGRGAHPRLPAAHLGRGRFVPCLRRFARRAGL
ncbi:MAG: hypothetical protein AVDCRST_MAG68-1736, partial [uncultured Gemmatimonadetes bacterium]